MISEKTDIILKNIADLAGRGSIAAEQRGLCLEQLYELLSADASADSATVYGKICRLLGDTVTVEDKVFLCGLICKAGSADVTSILNFGAHYMNVPPGAHGKIAFVRNRYNDAAFATFSSLIPHSKSAYRATFEICCEAVSNGECEFTILPIENTSDGKMFGFYSLLDRHELRICAVCSVEDEELSKTVRYALAGRNYSSEHVEKFKSTQPKILEFCLTGTAELDLPRIIRAASLCSAEVYRLSGLPSHYDDLTLRFYYSFKLNDNSDLTAFLTYMKLEHPGYSAIGIYREI